MGRKYLGNVLFARRVSPEMAARLAEVAKGAIPLESRPLEAPVVVSVPVKEAGGLKLDSVVLEQAARIDELEKSLEQARSVALEPQTEDGAYWKERAMKAEKKVAELEHQYLNSV
jgi:hypothetical protein